MALKYADRVFETSTTVGTGTITLLGAKSGGYQTFVAGIGDTNTCLYCIELPSADEWEVGIGTVTDAASDTLARTTILASSNAGAAVNFSAGTKNVFQPITHKGLNFYCPDGQGLESVAGALLKTGAGGGTFASTPATTSNLSFGCLRADGTTSILEVGEENGVASSGAVVSYKTFEIENNAPTILLHETDRAANQGIWGLSATASELVVQARTDIGGGGGNLFKFTRTDEQADTFEAQNSTVTWFEVDNANKEVSLIDGQILARIGSSSAPPYSFINDPDTGLYQYGNDHMGIIVGAKLAVSIDENAGSAPILKFYELSTNGSQYIGLRAPAAVLPARTWVLPDDDPVTANGKFLTTNASGEWSFATAGGLANVVEDTTPQLGGNLDSNNFQIDAQSTSYPPVRAARETTASTVGGALQLSHDRTSGVTTDTGVALDFTVESGATVKYVGGIQGIVDGTVGDGKLVFRTYKTDVGQDVLTLDSDASTTFSGDILADWSSAPGSRDVLKSSVTNGISAVTITPNGTGTESYIVMEDNSTVGNNQFVSLGINQSTAAFIHSSKRGTGTAVPFQIHMDGQQVLEIETNYTLNVSGVTAYESLVTDDDDIPNKKYVDDAVAGAGGISNVVEDTTPQLGGTLDSNGFAGNFDAATAEIPLTTNVTGGAADTIHPALMIAASKGSNMGNGFGVNMLFQIEDDASGLNTIAEIRAVRQDHDTSGTLKFITYSEGNAKDSLNIERDGTLNVANIPTYENLVTSDDDIPNKKYVDDAITAAPSGISNVVEDTTPQLGGDLDANGHNIILKDEGGSANNRWLGFFTTADGSGELRVQAATDALVPGALNYFAFDRDTSQQMNRFEARNAGTTWFTIDNLNKRLDIDDGAITGPFNGDVSILPNGTGNVVLGNFKFDVDQSVGVGQDNYVLTYNHAAQLISLEAVPGGAFLPLTGGTLTGPLLIPDGTVGAPGLAFSSSAATGLWKSGSGLGVAVQGEHLATFQSTHVDFLKYIQVTGGTVASPTIQHTTDTNTGIYWDGADGLTLSTAGVQRLVLDSTGRLYTGTLTSQLPLGAQAGSMLISTGNSSIATTQSTSADDLIIEGSSHTGITIGSPNTASCNIYFSDPQDFDVGGISYDHVTNGLGFTVNAGLRFTIESDGTLSVPVGTYETLVTADDDIPNKKYVDDAVAGAGGLSNIVEDTSPQLGGNCDVNDFYFWNGTSKLDLNDTTATYLQSADGTTTGQQLIVIAGQGTAGVGGQVNLMGGDGTSNGGNVVIQSGDGGTGNGGEINFQLGSGASNSGGYVTIKAPIGSTSSPYFILREAAANGTHGIWLRAPASTTANRFYTLPQDDPSTAAGKVLTIDASGVWSFTADAGLPLTGGTLTGQLLLPNGSATDPAIAFTSDTDVGIYRDSSLGFVIGTAGTARMHVNTIGTITTGSAVSGARSSVPGSMVVSTGASGLTAYNISTFADDLVVESNLDAGISIVTPNNKQATINFGDPDDVDVGQINYHHFTNLMKFTCNATQVAAFDSNLAQIYQDLRVRGDTLQVGYALTTATSYVNVGAGRTGDGASIIQLDTNTTYPYGARINRSGGANGSFDITHRGTGDMVFDTLEAARIRFSTNNVDAFQIETDGTLSSLITNYETLVTADDDIPNKKYVDDAITTGAGGASSYYYATSSSNLTIGTTATTSAAVVSLGTIVIPTSGVFTLRSVVSRMAAGGTASAIRYGLKINGSVYTFGEYRDGGVIEYYSQTVNANETDENLGTMGSASAGSRLGAPSIDIAESGMSTGSQTVEVVFHAGTSAATLQGATTTTRVCVELIDGT